MKDVVDEWIEFIENKGSSFKFKNKEELVKKLYDTGLVDKNEYTNAMYDIINESICPKCGKLIDGYSSIQSFDKHYHRDCFHAMKNSFPVVKDGDRTALEKVCAEYIEACLKGEEDTDLDHYIFEEAVKYIYGKEIFRKL